MTESNVTKIMSVPFQVIGLIKDVQEAVDKLYKYGTSTLKPKNKLFISEEWIEEVSVLRWRAEEEVSKPPNNIILAQDRRLVFSCDEDRRLNFSILGFYNEFEKTIFGKALVSKLKILTDSIAQEMLREEMARRTRLATENQAAAGGLPSVAEMKRYYRGYCKETALDILGAFPAAHYKYEEEGGRWGSTIIASKTVATPTTVGRYLNAFRNAGITEWLGIPMPKPYGKTDF